MQRVSAVDAVGVVSYNKNLIFLASPFIKGGPPALLNIYYMDGGCTGIAKDCVEYRNADHDNIEAFAGRGVYLGILGDTFYDRDAYNFDQATGEITRKKITKV